MPTRDRPARKRLPDFAGRPVTLPSEPESWRKLGDGKNILLLGLGPGNPAGLPFIPENVAVYWLDAPKTLAALRMDDRALPEGWIQVDKERAAALAQTCAVHFYKPGLRLAPDFWSGLLARIELAGATFSSAKDGLAWLPGRDGQLLHADLRRALLNLGFSRVSEASPQANLAGLLKAWNGELPDFALSVNFNGLDGEGRVFGLCAELGLPLAIWLVDNPWNLLSGIPLPWWREANLFVTDASFVEPLREYGAKNVRFAPLAASYVMLDWQNPDSVRQKPVFVGSSAFPAKRKFFSGLKIGSRLLAAAEKLVKEGKNPDFHWLQTQCGARLWPGREGRIPAFAADEFSARRRAAWLKAGLDCGLRVIGDSGWRELLPDAGIMPPVAYEDLPGLYGASECVLNVTSLLLPQSLNQRHFDVWAAGGFLLTDYTAGLEIFPKELVEPVVLRSPGDFCRKLAEFEENPLLRNELAARWQVLIREKHSYEHRIAEMAANTAQVRPA